MIYKAISVLPKQEPSTGLAEPNQRGSLQGAVFCLDDKKSHANAWPIESENHQSFFVIRLILLR